MFIKVVHMCMSLFVTQYITVLYHSNVIVVYTECVMNRFVII